MRFGNVARYREEVVKYEHYCGTPILPPPPTNVAFKRSQEYSRSGVLTSTLDRQQAAGGSSRQQQRVAGGSGCRVAAAGEMWRV